MVKVEENYSSIWLELTLLSQFSCLGLFVSSFLKHLNIKNESLGLSLSWKFLTFGQGSKFPCRLNNDLHERENDLIADAAVFH